MDYIQKYLLDPGWCPPPEIDRLLKNDCHLFAIAVQRLTGWKIVAFTEPRYISTDKDIPQTSFHKSLFQPSNKLPPYAITNGLVHAMCCVVHYGSIRVFDAKGWRSLDDLKQEYLIDSNCGLVQYTQQDLYSLVHRDQLVDEDKIIEVTNFVKKYYSSMFDKA